MPHDSYRVFISRVNSEFGHASSAIASDLRARGLEVKVQEDFTQGHTAGTWLDRLHEYIRDCDAVVCIYGARSGGFPAENAIQPYTALQPPGLSRLSFTQWEYFFAKHHRKNIFAYQADAAWTPDALASAEDDAGSQQQFLHHLHHHDNRISQPFDSALKLQNLVLREKWPDHSAAKPSNLPGGYIGQLFLGRDDFLDTLHQSLTGGGHATAITQKTAATGISGLGGIGKTHAAVEYAHRHRGDYTALLFAGGDSPEKLHSSFANLCGVLRLDENGSLPPDEPTRVRAALDWLASHPGWLLIIDNVDDEPAARALTDLLGQLTAGKLLITTRLHGWSHQVKNLDLSVLTPEASTALLLELTAEGRRLTDDDESQARQLAELLDGLPLAIHQAAGYINEQALTLAAYRARYQEEAAGLLNWFSDFTIPYERPEKLAPRPVIITWKTNFDKLSATDRFWLLVFAHFSPEPIPNFLIEPLSDVTAEDRLLLINASTAITSAGKYCLLTRSRNAPIFKIHRLVQQITRHHATYEERQSALAQAIYLITLADPGNPVDVRTWPKWNSLLSHAVALCEHAPDDPAPRDLTWLLARLDNLFDTKALHAKAEIYSRRALKIDRATYGEDHPRVAVKLNNLAQLLQDTNRLTEAEPLMRDALRIDRTTYGEDHPNVARSLNNLAQLLLATNRLTEAEPLVWDALRIDRAAYGEDHPDVAIDLNNLAHLLQATNRLTEAEPLMWDALRIDRAAYGEDHPDVAVDLNNLAQLLKATNRLTEAEPLMWDALRIDRAAYGEDHPNVAMDLNNLATLLQATNRLTEAEPLMRDALRIFHDSLGQEHPNTLIVSRNLDLLLEEMRNLQPAGEG